MIGLLFVQSRAIMNRMLKLVCVILLLVAVASKRQKRDRSAPKRREKGDDKKELIAGTSDVKDSQYDEASWSKRSKSESKSMIVRPPEDHDQKVSANVETQEKEKFIRCRMCGAKVALKRYIASLRQLCYG